MPETTPLIKAALNLRVGAGFDVYGGQVRGPSFFSFLGCFSGVPLNGKQFGCGHTPKFLQGAGPAKMLVGELPKPAVLRDKLSQSPGALHRSLRPVTIVPGPYFHARLLCRADDQCSLLLPRPPAFAAGPPGILHKALSFVPPAHGGIFLVLQS